MLDLRSFKKAGRSSRRPWTMLTAYDAPTAQVLSKCGIDLILVGDSLGMVLLGYPSTRDVTLEEMIHHVKAVRRGAPKSAVIADMPFKGLGKSPKDALKSAWRLIEAGADAVKIEWAKQAFASTELLSQKGVPVMGHVGLTPQAVKPGQAFKLRGARADEALQILRQSMAFEESGAFSVLLECVPSFLAREVTKRLAVPTIGIGAGRDCDGQVLVFQDLVGLFPDFKPRFVRRYADLGPLVAKAVSGFARDVKRRGYPGSEESFGMKPDEQERFKKYLKEGFGP